MSEKWKINPSQDTWMMSCNVKDLEEKRNESHDLESLDSCIKVKIYHHHHLLVLVHQGRLEGKSDEGETINCIPNEWVLFRDASKVSIVKTSENTKYFCIDYGWCGAEKSGEHNQCLFVKHPDRYYFKGNLKPTLHQEIKFLCECKNCIHICESCRRNEILWRVIGSIVQDIEKQEKCLTPSIGAFTESDRKKLEELRQFMCENPCETLGFYELCNRFSLNSNKVKQGFKHCYGNTVYAYWKSVKFEYARMLLKSGRCNVVEAALAIGYDNPSHFANTFRKRFGLAPKRYQKEALQLIPK
jgi:AraC-like DNA-binding protein